MLYLRLILEDDLADSVVHWELWYFEVINRELRNSILSIFHRGNLLVVNAQKLAVKVRVGYLRAGLGVQGYEEWKKAVLETPIGTYRVYVGLKYGVGDANKLAEYIVAYASTDVNVDELAAKAINNGKSLLPAGVKKINGTFEKGDHILVKDQNNVECARGLTSFSSTEIEKIKGSHSSKIKNILGYSSREEIIHKDDLVKV